MLADDEIRFLYGKTAIITRKGSFILVHLDHPSRGVIRRRTREFNPERFFVDDCPLCQMMKEGGVVVYDEEMESGEAGPD